MVDYYDLAENTSLEEILRQYAIAGDFLDNMNLGNLDRNLPLPDALESADQEWLDELGMDIDRIIEEFADFLQLFSYPERAVSDIRSLTVTGGHDKDGIPERASITVNRGEVLSIVGPTGSGKSRFLADIECLAQEDTPTGRIVLIDGKAPDEEERFELEGRLVAQLSQNMNFVMDLSVEEFLRMHARSRMSSDPEQIAKQCFVCANELAGEEFTMDTKVTQLSGGQSRALMIADTAFMSSSPVVLIDEIENAGIDRRQAISILAKNDKIVLISTHDPLLALGADRRIVIRNGGIRKVIDSTEEERKSLKYIEKLDEEMMSIRDRLRRGDIISADWFPGGTAERKEQ